MTAYDLRAHGGGRLGDALRLAAPVRGWTVDGFDAEPRDARGALTLVLDGVPWQGTSTVEPRMLDALPVAVSEIDRIVYCPSGALVAGRLVGSVLHVETAPPERVAGLADYGNETGDPGPARYLDRDLPNVDHWGPDGELVARSGSAWATLRARSFLPTDSAIVARTTAVSARFPEHQTLLGAVSAGSPDGASRGRVAAFASGELPFLPRAQREVAVRRRWVQAGGRLRRNPWGDTKWGGIRGELRGDVWGGVRVLDAPTWAATDSAAARLTGWREAFAGGSAGRNLRDGLAVGVRGDVMHVRGDAPRPNANALPRQAEALAGSAGVWLSVSESALAPPPSLLLGIPRRLSPALAADATIATQAGGGARLGGGVLLSGTPEYLWASGGWAWRASARRTPAAASPDASYWRAAGLAPLVRDGGPGADIATDEASVAVDWTLPPVNVVDRDTELRDGIHVSHSPRLRGRLALAGGWTRSPVFVAADEPSAIQTEAWSRRWVTATAWARHWPGVAYTATSAVYFDADAAFTLTDSDGDGPWPKAPQAVVGLSATYLSGRALALSARAEASTASNSRAVRGDLPARVPGGVVVDVSARRSVWGDRLALALVGHNVLGAPEQPSAVGARLGPRLHARLSARF